MARKSHDSCRQMRYNRWSRHGRMWDVCCFRVVRPAEVFERRLIWHETNIALQNAGERSRRKRRRKRKWSESSARRMRRRMRRKGRRERRRRVRREGRRSVHRRVRLGIPLRRKALQEQITRNRSEASDLPTAPHLECRPDQVWCVTAAVRSVQARVLLYARTVTVPSIPAVRPSTIQRTYRRRVRPSSFAGSPR